MERKEVEEKYKCNTADIYPSDEAWEKEFAETEAAAEFTEFKGKLGDAETLLKFFTLRDSCFEKQTHLEVYARAKHYVDLRVQKYSAYMSRVSSLYTLIYERSVFSDAELLELPEETLKEFINNPLLKDWDYELVLTLKARAHIISADGERVLALAGEATRGYYDAFLALNNLDLALPECELNGKTVQMTHGRFMTVLHSGTREERENWFKAYYGAYEKRINTFAEVYVGRVKTLIFYARAQNYKSSLEASLSVADIPVSVYENLISSVNSALPEFHKYISLRGRVLGLKEQHMYDIYAPFAKDVDTYTYDEAFDLVVKALSPLGEEYKRILLKVKAERWIDVYETAGKKGGGTTIQTGAHPYIILNFRGGLRDVFILAHELGHAVHGYLETKAQPFSKRLHTTFTAEVASQCNEILLIKYLYNNAKDINLKKYILGYYLDNLLKASFFRQTQLAEFQQTVHAAAEAGKGLTRDYLCGTYYELNKKYFGEGIVHDEEISCEWARIGQLYTGFYVYQYATGIAAAISIANKILEKGESAVGDYFEFLSSGCSMPPVEELCLAGVDLTTAEPFKEAIEEFTSAVSGLEKLE